MPYISASSSSQQSFQNLREKHDMDRKSNKVANSFAQMASTDSLSSVSSSKSTLDFFQLSQPPPVKDFERSGRRSMSVGSIASSNFDIESKELINLPNESTHVYSYNPLSPNSLAVRLNILKRSLEILIKNPDMLRDPTHGQKTSRDLSDAIAENFPANKKSSLSDNNKKINKLSTHSAALHAFVTRTSTSTNKINGLNTTSNGQAGPIPLQRATSLMLIPNHYVSQLSEDDKNLAKLRSRRRLSDVQEDRVDLIKQCMVENETIAPSITPFYKNEDASNSTELINSRATDLEELLNLLNETLQNNTSNKASDLHMISLLNINKLNIGDENSSGSQIVGKILLDSLAEPFFEHKNRRDSEVVDDELELENEMHEFIGSEDSNLTATRPQQDYGRLLHIFTSMKNSAPHAIFTCCQAHPWQFKAANDLACLTFGVSRNALRALTLLDLIHSDSRNFVLHKLMSTEGQEIVFTGEIVAIVQPDSSKSTNLIWASMWAKRKNNLLVCVFEKVPCDYIDIKLNTADYSVDEFVDQDGLFKQNKFNIQSNSKSSSDVQKMEPTVSDSNGKDYNKKKSVKFVSEITDIGTISKSLSSLIKDVVDEKVRDKDDDLFPMPIRVANHINKIRYFTLNHLTYNIPCAVSASILEKTLKLKLHSLPYEAGLFIIDSNSLQIISVNKSIVKNLFGFHFFELVGKSITSIIPSFSDIIDFMYQKYQVLDISSRKNKGMVLTEHFFRKIQAEMNGNVDEFYGSVGIDGLHRDGCFIKVDMQLRVVDSHFSFLWITHSRDVVIQNYNSTPSQLKILKESDLAYVSSNSSSATSSKRSSSKLSLTSMTQLSLDDKLKGHSHVDDNSEKQPVRSQSTESLKSKAEIISQEKADVPNISVEVDDEDLKRQVEIAKVYFKDKSQFVKDGNFKVDENLILNLSSSPQSTKSSASLVTLTDNQSSDNSSAVASADDTKIENLGMKDNPENKTSLLQTPVTNIGEQKRNKKISDFVVLEKMGEGAYGKVKLCLHKKKKYIVVIKMIFKERILVDTWVRDRALGTIPSEIQIMATLNKHPQDNILKLLDFFEDEEYYYIETPIHGETGCIDLFDLIEFKSNMTESEARLIFIQVVAAIKHLHEYGIVHRDIKDENVIVDSKGFAKLIDFGSAAYVKSGPFDVFVGTIDYAAPEVLSGEPYIGKPQDIWALGILLYTIVFKENPFYNIDEILEGELKFNTSLGISEECIDLIKQILIRVPAKRPTIDEIYHNKWLSFE